MIELPCPILPGECEQHKFPDDWEFGGASGTDPRADARWRPTTYEYYDANVSIVWTTQTPLCDEEALDDFTFVAGIGRAFRPIWLSAKRTDGTVEMLKWVYDPDQDLLVPKG